MLKHYAFYISNREDKEELLSRITSGDALPELHGLKIFLYAQGTLEAFIKEEQTHDKYNIINGAKNSFQKYSSGEKKKLLLQYAMLQNPNCIVFDNVFDYLDATSVPEVYQAIKKLSETVIVVQLTTRKSEIMDFVQQVYSVKDDKITPEDKELFIKEGEVASAFSGRIPPPLFKAQSSENPLVLLNNVSVYYEGVPIVRAITWRINKGEFWQLKGPNGSGKTTLLSLITGESTKAYGQDITLFGHKKGSESLWDIRKHMGYFSTGMSSGFYRLDSIRDILVSGFLDSLGLYKTPTQAQTKLADEWLDLLEMSKTKNTPFIQLSEGSRRLVLIARAMVKHPELLILDEPTAGLDDAATLLFIDLVNKIASETTTAIVYVSHKEEQNLKPSYLFQLLPSQDGSSGKALKIT